MCNGLGKNSEKPQGRVAATSPPPPHLLLVRLHPKVNKKLSIVLSTVASVLHVSYPSI